MTKFSPTHVIYSEGDEIEDSAAESALAARDAYITADRLAREAGRRTPIDNSEWSPRGLPSALMGGPSPSAIWRHGYAAAQGIVHRDAEIASLARSMVANYRQSIEWYRYRGRRWCLLGELTAELATDGARILAVYDSLGSSVPFECLGTQLHVDGDIYAWR